MSIRNKIYLLLLTLLGLLGCSPSIEYDLHGHEVKTPIKYAGAGQTTLRNNKEYKVLYSSLSVEYDNGYSSAVLTIFNKSNETFIIRSVSFYHVYDGSDVERAINYKGNMKIEPYTDNNNPFYPQESFTIKTEGSINTIYDKFKKIEEIEVIVLIDMLIGTSPITVKERFKVFQQKSLFR